MKGLKNALGKAIKLLTGKAQKGTAGDPCCCTCDAIYKPLRKCSDDSLTTIIMTETDAATFPGGLKYSGVCYYFGADAARCKTGSDTLIVAASATAFDDCAACEDDGACPADCVDTDFASSLAISGYFDGFFAAAAWSGGTTANAPWDGTFKSCPAGGCNWTATNFATGCSYVAPGVTGSGAVRYKVEGLIQFNAGGSPCWVLQITPDNSVDIWSGTKDGSSPFGVYTRTSGSDTTPTITIV